MKYFAVVRDRRRRSRNFCPDWTSVDEWRGHRSRPPNVAGGVRGGTQNCRRHLQQQHQQQRQKQQQQQLFAGNFFTVNVRKFKQIKN